MLVCVTVSDALVPKTRSPFTTRRVFTIPNVLYELFRSALLEALHLHQWETSEEFVMVHDLLKTLMIALLSCVLIVIFYSFQVPKLSRSQMCPQSMQPAIPGAPKCKFISSAEAL
jgi:hypothetical protein